MAALERVTLPLARTVTPVNPANAACTALCASTCAATGPCCISMYQAHLHCNILLGTKQFRAYLSRLLLR